MKFVFRLEISAVENCVTMIFSHDHVTVTNRRVTVTVTVTKVFPKLVTVTVTVTNFFLKLVMVTFMVTITILVQNTHNLWHIIQTCYAIYC